MVTTQKLLEAIETIAQFCNEQKSCKNCILQKRSVNDYLSHCQAPLNMNDIHCNIEAKKKADEHNKEEYL